jgi:transposase
MLTMPKAHPDKFRGEMVAVFYKQEAPIAQMAQDFGTSESNFPTGVAKPVIEDAGKPSVTASESTRLRGARKRIRQLE